MHTQGLQCKFSVKSFCFILLLRDWYWVNSKHLIITASICFFAFRAFNFSEPVYSHSSALGIQHYFKVFHHLRFSSLLWDLYSLNFSLPLNPGPSGKRSVPRAAWCLATLLPASSFSPQVENLQWLYNFPVAHTILVVTFPSSMPPMQFIWHFCHVLFTLRHRYISCLLSTWLM